MKVYLVEYPRGVAHVLRVKLGAGFVVPSFATFVPGGRYNNSKTSLLKLRPAIGDWAMLANSSPGWFPLISWRKESECPNLGSLPKRILPLVQAGPMKVSHVSHSCCCMGGTTCLSDYCCCWTASTRAGEPEKPILSGGRWLFDETAWNSMRSSCSPWETDKSVVLVLLPLVHFGSFWFILVPPRMRYSNWKTKSLKSRRFLALSGGFYLLKLAS